MLSPCAVSRNLPWGGHAECISPFLLHSSFQSGQLISDKLRLMIERMVGHLLLRIDKQNVIYINMFAPQGDSYPRADVKHFVYWYYPWFSVRPHSTVHDSTTQCIFMLLWMIWGEPAHTSANTRAVRRRISQSHNKLPLLNNTVGPDRSVPIETNRLHLQFQIFNNILVRWFRWLSKHKHLSTVGSLGASI